MSKHIPGRLRWSAYLLAMMVNSLLLAYSIEEKQKGGGIGEELFRGVGILYNDHKPNELISYLIGAAILFFVFVYHVAVHFWKSGRWDRKPMGVAASSMRLQWANTFNYFSILVLPAVALLWVPDLRMRVFVQSYVVLYALFSMYAGSFVRRLATRAGGIVMGGWTGAMVPVVLMCCLLGQVVYVFQDHIFGRPKIMNEYYNIPDYTKAGNGYVKGSVLMNSYYQYGSWQKYDMDDGGRYEDYGVAYDGTQDGQGGARMPAGSVRASLFTLNDSFGVEEYVVNEESRNSDLQERGLIEKSDFQFHWQVLERYMIHHHGFVLNPVSELELGRPLREIKAQYGLGNIFLFRAILKAMGGISFDNWLQVNAGFYVLYYFLYGLVLLRIFANRWAALLVFMLSLLVLNLHGYEFLILAPGDSPWRYFFDVPIVYTLYRHQKDGGRLFAGASLAMGALSVFMSPEIGMMILVAVVAALLIHAAALRRLDASILAMSALSLAAGAILFVLFSSKGGLTVYYLKGVIGSPISAKAVVLVFATFFSAYALLVYDLKQKRLENYLLLVYLFVYCQGLVFYYVWHSDNNGLLARSHIYVLAVSWFQYEFMQCLGSRSKWFRDVAGVAVIGGVLFGVVSFTDVVAQRKRYNEIFASHKAFRWNFDRAGFLSTMDPGFFSESVSMIRKYSAGSPSICMISEYDNLLPFLANRYNIMPFHDLKWYNVTTKELLLAIEVVRKSRPRYLYVDTGIDRDWDYDIIPPNLPHYGYLHDESVWRSERHKLLAVIFHNVRDDYELVAVGRMISVFKLKGT